MKPAFILLCLSLLVQNIFAQAGNKFRTIDQRARATGYYPIKELAGKLTKGYKEEEEKVRSVFTWITTHIAYDFNEYRHPDADRYKPYESLIDESISDKERWDQVLALAALKDKMAVCAGYAALFKQLCTEAGLTAVIINGCARSYDDVGKPYQSNHAWNAVMINKEWKLMDVTWASGYLDEARQKAVRKYNAFYYCTAPEMMILNHLPDMLRWTLLPNPPSRKDFTDRPYINAEQSRALVSFHPLKGVLERKSGDSVIFRVEIKGKPEKVEIYNVEDDSWSSYSNATPEPLPLNGESTPRASKLKKEITAKEDAVIDAILAYSNSFPPQPEDKVAAQMPEHKEKMAPQTFTVSGGEFRFAYHVKHKGARRLVIFCNGEAILAYQVNGR